MKDKRLILEPQKNKELQILTEQQKRKIKSILLEMCEDIFRFCDKHNLCCMLGGGSALGAVRHGGFIPWDDDIDLNMPRKDYNIFISLFSKEYEGKYTLYVPDANHKAFTGFLKVSRNNTIKEDIFMIGKKVQPGISIDVFPIEWIPESPVARIVKGCGCNILRDISTCVFYFQNRTPQLYKMFQRTNQGKLFLGIRMAIGALMSFRSYEWWFKKFNQFAQCNEQSNQCTIPTGRKKYFGEMQDKSVFIPPQKSKFESIDIYIPANVNKYLETLYGDYMTIPPVEKREQHFYTRIEINI